MFALSCRGGMEIQMASGVHLLHRGFAEYGATPLAVLGPAHLTPKIQPFLATNQTKTMNYVNSQPISIHYYMLLVSPDANAASDEEFNSHGPLV
jgi:hypothetical protein